MKRAKYQPFPTIRFWYFHRGGWVRLALRLGQSLHHSLFERTDEGHSFEYHRWTYEPGCVLDEWCAGGRDCDGAIRNTGEHAATLADIAAVPAYDDGRTDHLHAGKPIMRPAWEKVAPVQVYDEYAQLAGY